MLKAAIKKLFLAQVGDNVEAFGYEVEFRDGADTYERILSNSGVLKKETLEALNRAGFTLVHAEPFPRFVNSERPPHDLESTPYEILNNLPDIRRIAIVPELQKDYVRDVKDYTIYSQVIPDLRALKTTSQVLKDQQQRIQEGAVASAETAKQYENILSNKPTEPEQTPDASAQSVPPQESAQVNTVVSSDASVTDNKEPVSPVTTKAEEAPVAPAKPKVKGVRDVPTEYPYPGVALSSEVTFNDLDESDLTAEEIQKRNVQGYVNRGNYDYILNHFGVKKITTVEEYQTFLKDFNSGRLTAENDFRAILNLNWFVDASLLHKSIFSFVQDKELQTYREVKKSLFNLKNITTLVKGLERLNESEIGSDLFKLCAFYFGNEPLEGYDHLLYRCYIDIQNRSLARKGLTKIVLKKDGQIDLTGMKNDAYQVVAEYDNYAIVSHGDVDLNMVLRNSVKDFSTVIEVSGKDSDITVTYNIAPELRDLGLSPKISFGPYFTIHSTIDRSVILPLPDSDGTFSGYDEESYIFKTRLDSKISKLTAVNYDRNEYEVLYKAGFSAKDMGVLLTRGNPSNKRGRDFLISKGMSENLVNNLTMRSYVPNAKLDEYIATYGITEQNIYDVLGTSIAADKEFLEAMDQDSDIDQEFLDSLPMGLYSEEDLKSIYAIATEQLTTPEGDSAINTDSYRSQYNKVSMLAKAAMESNRATPQEILAELNRVESTREPVSFNTGVQMGWFVDGEAFYQHLDLMEEAMVRQRRVISNGIAEVTAVIRNHTGTEYIGVMYNLTVPDEPHFNGVYAESFFKLRDNVELTKIAVSNGLITSTSFIPNDGLTIPVVGCVDVFSMIRDRKIKFLEMDMKDPASLHPYITDRFFKAVVEYEKTKKFIEPVTPHEVIFGVSDLRNKILLGQIDAESLNLPTVSDKVIGVGVPRISLTAKENMSNRTDTASNPESSVNTDVNVVDKPSEEPEDIKEKEVTKEITEKVPSDFDMFESLNAVDGAEYEIKIRAVIHNVLFESDIVDQRTGIGVWFSLTNLSTTKSYTAVESFVDLLGFMGKAKMFVSNARIAYDRIEMTAEPIRNISVLSPSIAKINSMQKNPPTRTDMAPYIAALKSSLDEGVTQGKSAQEIVSSLPTDPVSVHNEKIGKQSDSSKMSIAQVEKYLAERAQPTALTEQRVAVDGTAESAMLKRAIELTGELNALMRTLYEKNKKQDSPHQVIAMSHRGFYVKAEVTQDQIFLEDKDSEQLVSESNRSLIGLVRVSPEYYIVHMEDGSYALLDNKLNRIV